MLVIGLAIAAGLVGVGQQLPTINVSASEGAESASGPQKPQAATQQLKLAGISVQLPEIKSIKLPPVPVKKTEGKDPFIGATNVIVLDDASKIPLYEKDADKRIAVASTTKVATAMVALKHYNLSDKVTISPAAAGQIGSAVGFRVGETATIEQLLYGLMIVSGNDAAYALAEQLAQPGDADPTERFITEMNKLARQLSMNDTNFKQPAGLDDSAYSSAADMAKMMSYAIKNKAFKEIIGHADYEYTSPGGQLHKFHNSNRLSTEEMFYPGIIGGKTGFTPETPEGGAGHCLIVAAERNGHTLIAAVYRTYSQTPQASAEVAKAALDYAFNNYTWQEITR